MRSRWTFGFDRTEISYRVTGGGIPLILSNGLGCPDSFWDPFLKRLGDRFRLIFWHYRGHGNSEIPVNFDNLSVGSHARDLHSIMEREGIQRAILLGFSLGVQVTLDFYSMHPERVAGLILMCGGHKNRYTEPSVHLLLNRLFPPAIRAARILSRLLPPVNRCIDTLPVIYHLFHLLGITGSECDPRKFRTALRHIARMNLTLYLEMLEHLGRHSIEEVLECISVPSLIIAAENDFFIPREVSLCMHDNIAGAEFFLLEGASHYALIETPDRILDRIENFLENSDFGRIS